MQVAVFNQAGAEVSAVVQLIVLPPVMFTLQPQPQNVLPGTNVTIASLALGTGTVRYQWRFAGTNLPGATNASYSFTGANLDDHHGDFSVVAMDDISTTVSSNAFVYVLVKPVVVVNPTPQTVLQWQTATFSVIATGAPPLNYRWLRNGVNWLSNAEPTLVITNCQSNGTFRAAIVNFAGSVNSSSVALTVIPDSDADGIPNSWESAYFSNPTNASATADADGDGMNNRDEYVAGTNPTNALSVLKITLTTTNAGWLQFVAQTNLGYTVQYRTNLESAVWNNLTSIAPQSLVRTVQVNAPNPPPESERFYRIATPPVP